MKLRKIYYILTYIVAIIVGKYINVLGIPSLFDMPIIVIPLYNFLVLRYAIIYPLEKDELTTKKALFWPFMISSNIFNIIFCLIIQVPLSSIVTLILSNIIEWIILKPKKEISEDIINKNIKEYFNKKS